MTLGTARERVLRGLSRRPGTHRMTRWRLVVGVVSTLAIAALPLLGILRFDLWGGRHLVLGEELGVVEAAKAFAFPFLAVNVVILVLTRLVGRFLCGFVCPVGALGRLGEWARRKRKSPLGRLVPEATLLGTSFVLAVVTAAFWVDLRVFVAGSPAAMGVAGAFVLGTTLVLHLGARSIGLRFCRDWCPSGVYFAVLGPESRTGIELAHPETCTDCGACDSICPMDLKPREVLAGPARGGSGLYPEGMTNLALCIRCGDCIHACEGVNVKRDGPVALRMGFCEPAGDEPAEAHP